MSSSGPPFSSAWLVCICAAALVRSGEACDVTVTTSGLTFSPASVVIAVGQRVCWTPGSTHNVQQTDAASSCTLATSPIFGSSTLGERVEHTFTQTGSFFYRCGPHCGFGMVGRVVVTPTVPPTPAPTDAPTTTTTAGPTSSPTSYPTTSPTQTPTVFEADNCTCPPGSFIARACEDGVPAQCQSYTRCLPGVSYVHEEGTATRDTECRDCATCSGDRYAPLVRVGCGGTDDRTVCRPKQSCNEGSTFESDPGTFTRNRVCTFCRPCADNEFIAIPCNVTSDTTCRELTPPCGPGYFEAMGPTATTDRVCQACQACATGQYASTQCTTNSNTVCSSEAACTGIENRTLREDEIVASLSAGNITILQLQYGNPSTVAGSIARVTVTRSHAFTVTVSFTSIRMRDLTVPATLTDGTCSSSPSGGNTIPNEVFNIVCDRVGLCTARFTGSRPNVPPTSHSQFTLVILDHISPTERVLCADILSGAPPPPPPPPGTCFIGCPRGRFFNQSTSLCDTCSTCSAGQFASGGCATTVDTLCTNHKTCADSEYRRTPGTLTTDAVCAPCSICGGDEVETSSCTATSDTVCAARTECTVGQTYATTHGTPTTDRQCAPCQSCSAGEFTTRPCSYDLNTFCLAKRTRCPRGEYETRAATATSDLECETCSECSTGFEAAASCNGTFDTLCVESIAQSSDDDSGPAIIVIVIVVIVVLLFCGLIVALVCLLTRDPNAKSKRDSKEVFVAGPSESFGFGGQPLTPEEEEEERLAREAEEEAARQLEEEQAREEERRARKEAEEARLREFAKVRLSSTRVKQSRKQQDAERQRADQQRYEAERAATETDDPWVVSKQSREAFLATEAAHNNMDAEGEDVELAIEARRRQRAERAAEAERARRERTKAEVAARTAAQIRKEEEEKAAALAAAQAEEEQRLEKLRQYEAEQEQQRLREAGERQARIDERRRRFLREQKEAEARVRAAREAEERRREQERLDMEAYGGECTNLPNCECPKCVREREDEKQLDEVRKRRSSGFDPENVQSDPEPRKLQDDMLESDFGFPP
eukprot:m.132038 g.132038  ORF g.132038 m.132038 type:complete len:1053 (+) comp11323_c0_seq1:224-3382(+)